MRGNFSSAKPDMPASAYERTADASNGLSNPTSMAPRLSCASSAPAGPRTLSTISAPRAWAAMPMCAPALWKSGSGMLDATPAPASTTMECLPLAASFLTVSGVAATRVSPSRVSRGMPMIMVSVPLAAGYSPCGSYLATTSGDRVGDRGSRLNSLRAAAQIRRARSISKHALDGAHDSCSSLRVTKMLEHHRARPDLPDGIGNAFTCDIRCGAMHGLEQRRVFAFGIDVRRWRDADRAAHGR